MVDALDKPRARLDQEDADGLPVSEIPDETAAWRALRVRPLGRDDVRPELPKLYARAAATNPDLLDGPSTPSGASDAEIAGQPTPTRTIQKGCDR